MPIFTPLQLAEEMTPVNRETCLNFIHFRNILKSHRSKCDDKIKQRLNSISSPKDQCQKFGENLKKAQESRMRNLKYCLKILNEESEKIVVLNDKKSKKGNYNENVLNKEVIHLINILSIFSFL